MSRYTTVPRPTERAALAAAARSARPAPPIQMILADLLAANSLGDRHGVNLAAHRAVRAVCPEVGE
ncbi:hypothetical protein [Streptomyces chilikensis]|uniref:Uncharacterized protein n=1 Tax=Streptomyces chilikensis TaxID=1194079 RepID=A0ABV3EYD4_9ACTN